MAVISQSESNFKQRQRALSGRLDRGELQTSQEMKAWITFSRLPRDKKRPHLFAGLNFSATERNKKAKLSFCSSSPSSNAITDWLAELKSIRCSEVISHTLQFISVVLPAEAEIQTYLSVFLFPDWETWLLAVRCALPTMQLSCRQIRLRFVSIFTSIIMSGDLPDKGGGVWLHHWPIVLQLFF